MLNKIWNFIVNIFSTKTEKVENKVESKAEEISVTTNAVTVKMKTAKPKSAPKMKASKEVKIKKAPKKK